MEKGEKSTKNVSWDRANGVDLQPGHEERNKRNVALMGQPMFTMACETAGVEPTIRQASKWNNGKGKAYKTKNNIFMTGVDRA